MIDDVAMAFMFLIILISSLLNLSMYFKKDKKPVIKIEGNMSKKDAEKVAREIIRLLLED